MGVEALGFDQAGAVEAEPAFAPVLVCLLQDGLLCPGGGGKNPDFAVGEDTIHVEKDEFDFFGAGFGHCVAILAFESGAPIDCPFAIATQPRLHYRSDHFIFWLALHIPMCDNPHMPTNLALDDRLIEEARRAGGHKTKKEAVNAALDEYVRRRKQLQILNAFGTIDFDPSYDYKAERRRRPGRHQR